MDNDFIKSTLNQGMVLGFNSALDALNSLTIEKAMAFIRRQRDVKENEIEYQKRIKTEGNICKDCGEPCEVEETLCRDCRDRERRRRFKPNPEYVGCTTDEIFHYENNK